MTRTLSDIMDFDHVVTVHDDGTVTDGPNTVWAPNLYDGELDSDKWEFATHGYSGQHAYSGPIMHNSEFIGGGLERDILATPGIYVAVIADWSPDAESGEDENSDTIEGWAIVRFTGTAPTTP